MQENINSNVGMAEYIKGRETNKKNEITGFLLLLPFLVKRFTKEKKNHCTEF